MSYKTAMARPTSAGGSGWAHADEESLEAARAEVLGAHHCINAKNIFDWAQKRGVSLRENMKILRPFNDVLLVAVLNDWSLGEAQRRIADAEG